ncbi:MAG: hypothetical protein ABI678_01645 [Kofleriaceae bacterium]
MPTAATTWLSRAFVVSLVLHLVVLGVVTQWLSRDTHEVELVDIELAPPPPVVEALPPEVAQQIAAAEAQHAAAAGSEPAPPTPGEGEGPIDAGVDAPPDAAPARDAGAKHAKDAGVDAEEMLMTKLLADAGDGSGSLGAGSGSGSSAEVAAMEGSGSGASNDPGFAGGSGEMLGSGSAGSGSPAAIAMGSGSGVPGMDDQPAVEGAPTSAGTAANLLAYFPPGHTLSVLVRFDRLRGSEWAAAAEELFRPMPDYQGLFGSRSADLATKLDMLVISTPRPRDAVATTLVMKTPLPRSSIRDLLANTVAPIAWSTAKGGALGKRTGKVFQGDKRVVLSPWRGWYLFAQPEDLGALTAAGSGSVDAAEAKGKLPAWLAGIRTIAKESGDDKKGPALVMTIGEPPSNTAPAKSGRYKLPELGFGVRSLPVPQRISLAMELVQQGWLVRGNIVFPSEADAAELVQTLTDLRTRITDSHILSGLLRKQHALNLVTGLSLSRTGARVSYATSVSISDARAMLSAAAQSLGSYFGQMP